MIRGLATVKQIYKNNVAKTTRGGCCWVATPPAGQEHLTRWAGESQQNDLPAQCINAFLCVVPPCFAAMQLLQGLSRLPCALVIGPTYAAVWRGCPGARPLLPRPCLAVRRRLSPRVACAQCNHACRLLADCNDQHPKPRGGRRSHMTQRSWSKSFVMWASVKKFHFCMGAISRHH